MFVMRESGGFAGGSDGNDSVHAGLDLPFAKFLESVIVDSFVGKHGCSDGGHDAMEPWHRHMISPLAWMIGFMGTQASVQEEGANKQGEEV